MPGIIRFHRDGQLPKPLIGIKYPGKKVTHTPKGTKYKWCNLYDFKIIPYINDEPIPELFTFKNMLEDFYKNKIDNEDFWIQIEELYKSNKVSSKPPKLGGIDSYIYLLSLKWLWILEDLNYRIDVREENNKDTSKLKYKTKNTGVGRAKFFAALILLKERYFTKDEVSKIIPLFG